MERTDPSLPPIPSPASPLRWFDEKSYSASWGSRNADMLALFDNSIEKASDMSFAEYGCGAYSPFSMEVSKSSHRKVIRCDMNKWDNDVVVVDFNKRVDTIVKADVAVLSGVLEYVNNIENAFGLLSGFHRYVLMSYAIRPPVSSCDEFMALIEHRQSRNGWRSHLSIEEVVNIVCRFGFIKAMSIWQGHQILIALELYQASTEATPPLT